MSGRESTEQGRSGRRGAEALRNPGTSDQPPQGSQRVEAKAAEQEPEHHFDPGQAPSEQGEKDHPSGATEGPPAITRKRRRGVAHLPASTPGTAGSISRATGPLTDRRHSRARRV